MSEDSKTYKPEPELIDALARPVLQASDDKELMPKSEDAEIVEAESKSRQIVLDGENTKIAVSHIKDTLSTLKDLLDDLKNLAPASQQGFLFQTAAIIAKTRLDGSKMLASLEGAGKPEEKRGGARSNHLHLNVTSAQFGEFIADQVKKTKNGK